MSFVPRQEREAVPGRRLAIIAATSVAIALVGIVTAWRLERATTARPTEYSNVPPPPPRGTVERTLLVGPGRGRNERAAQRLDLERGGPGRLPIDRAIDRWVSTHQAGAGKGGP